MNNDKSTREFDRHMEKEYGIDHATEEFFKEIKEKELHGYAETIVAHVDKAVPKALLALGPPLTLGVLYLIMKTTVLMHPALILSSVFGVLSAFFFAIKYDIALRACRYSGIGAALAENKNSELKKVNRDLLRRVADLEAQLSVHLLKDEDIPF